MNSTLRLLSALPLVTGLSALHAQSPVPQSFINCISANGSGSTCPLLANTYAVSATLYIGRSNITITGNTSSDTILQRAADIPRIMASAPGVTGVTIRDLTFDGNRYSGTLNLNCKPNNPPYWDLDLSGAGTVTVEHVDFINAPGAAMILDGPSSVLRYSHFGMGSGTETGPQSATRATAVFLYGNQSGVWYNTIDYAGTAAVNVHGTYQYVYGNTMEANRYEMPDWSGGGQLFLDPSSSYASVAANFINGNYWSTGSNPPPINGCAVPPNQIDAGVEAYGVGHRFFNNGIIQNLGSGIQAGGSNPTGPLEVSSSNPWDGTDVVRCIRHNGSGIGLLGPGDCGGQCSIAVTGVTLDKVQVIDNGPYNGIYLHNSSGTGFINGSCMSNNTGGNIAEIPNPDTNLTYPYPSNYTSCIWAWQYCSQ